MFVIIGTEIRSTGTGADAATITIDGNNTGSANQPGVLISDAPISGATTVASVDGNITIVGRSGGTGVQIDDGAVVTSTGSTADAATITIDGRSNTSVRRGVRIADSGTTVTSDAGAIVITSPDAAGTGNDVRIDSSAVVEATNSTITIEAGDDFELLSGASLTAGGAITIASDFGNADAGTGSVIELAGNVTAASLELSGDTDDDTLRLTGLVAGQFAFSGDLTGVGNGHTNSALIASGLTPQTIGVHYDGGTVADQIEMSFTDALDTAYFADDDTAANSGVVNVDGEFSLSFSGLAPLVFSGAGGTLTVDASALPGLTTLTITDDPLDTAGPGGNVITGNGGFETTFFNGYTNLVVRGGDGSETITLVSVDPAANGADFALESITLDGDNIDGLDTAADTLVVESLPATNGEAVPQPISITLMGGAGNDSFIVGDTTNGLDDVLGSVSVRGESEMFGKTSYTVSAGQAAVTYNRTDGDLLTIRDGAAVNPGTYTISGSTVARAGTGTVTFATIERLTVNTSDTASSDIDVTGTPDNIVTMINAGGLADDIDVTTTGTDSVLIVNAGDGSDTIDVATTGNPSLTFLRGDAGADIITVANTSTDSTTGLDIDGGDDGDAITVTRFGGRVLNINGEAGSDAITLATADSGSDADIFGGTETDTITVGPDLDAIAGAVRVFGEGQDAGPTNDLTIAGDTNSLPGGDVLNVSDSLNTADRTYTVTATTVGSSGMTGSVTFATIEELNVNTTAGIADVDITTTLAGLQTTITTGDAADVIDIMTTGVDSNLILNTGDGADVVTIAATGPDGGDADALGAFVDVNGGGGDDRLLVDYSGPTGPAVNGRIRFNGEGQDSSPDGDVLTVIGGGTETAVYTPDAATPGNGLVTVADGGDPTVIEFAGVEPVDLVGLLNATISPTGEPAFDVANGTTADGDGDAAVVVTGTAGGVAVSPVRFHDNTNVNVSSGGIVGGEITLTAADADHQNVNLFVTAGSDSRVTVVCSLDFTGNVLLSATDVSLESGAAVRAGTGVSLTASEDVALATGSLTDGPTTLAWNVSPGGPAGPGQGRVDWGGPGRLTRLHPRGRR